MTEAKTKILVVDDDARLRDLLNRYLTEQGFTVRAISDATDMNRQLARERYDLMILDLKMPGRDGYEVLEWIRSKSQRPRVAVFTASALDTDKTRSTQLGADLFQTKSFEIDSLDRFITRLYSLCKPSPM